ncbi:MAG: chemotaxis protein CheX [Phycisphaeraceae bacterium JB051]
MKMDMRFIEPFVSSLQNVFTCMLGTPAQLGKPFLKGAMSQKIDIVAIISLSGDVIGTTVLGFPKETALAIASQFSGEEMTLDHPDLPDALGELINMVTGSAKANLKGITAAISLPRVIAGKNVHVGGPKTLPFVVIPFKSDLGYFYLELAVLSNEKSEAA